jgi:Bacterial SH3 domain
MRITMFPATALVLLFAAAPANAQSRYFLCDDGSTVNVTVRDDQSIQATPIDGETMTLHESPTEKWYFFRDDYSVRVSPDQARVEVEIPDWGVKKCVYRGEDNAAAGGVGLPHAATSWGGKVRSGPGTDYKDIGSLSEGERITILEQSTAPNYQDRPWFKIRFRGRTGFHWGGIICPLGEAIPGTYQVCNAGDGE